MADIPGQILPVVDEKRLADPIWYEWFTYLRGAVKSLLASIASHESAWTAFTPTVTSTAGGSPTFTSACRFKRNGATVHVSYDVTITAVGAASGFLRFSLPVASNAVATFAGREAAIVGRMMYVTGSGGGPYLVAFYDVSSTLVVNYRHILTGTYEVT